MSAGSEIWDAGRQDLATPWGDMGMDQAANLGFSNLFGGMRGLNAMTDPNLMLNVAQNPYVMGAVDAAANQAQARTSGTGFRSGNYGGSMHQRAAAGAIADSSNRVLNDAYQQGLQSLARGTQMAPGYMTAPMQGMDYYQMQDWRFLEPYSSMVSGFRQGAAPEQQSSMWDKVGAGLGFGDWLANKFPGGGMPEVDWSVGGVPMPPAGGMPW
jgi:hypothetical protein